MVIPIAQVMMAFVCGTTTSAMIIAIVQMAQMRLAAVSDNQYFIYCVNSFDR